MQNLIDLYTFAYDKNIKVYDYRMTGLDMDAVSIKTPNAIGIFLDYKQIDTSAKEKHLLGHELGHCETGALHKINSPFELKIKNEYLADRWAVHNIIPFNKLSDAINKGNTETWQLAEYFNVPEEFIHTAYKHYKNEGLIS